MAAKSAKQTPWKAEHEAWVREHGGSPNGWHSAALWREFLAAFPASAVGHIQFRQFAARIRDGSHVQLPPSPMDDLEDRVLRLESRVALVTSDWQIPYHDENLARFAFDLASEWGADLHVLNGDLFDFANLSKFDPSLHDYRRDAGLEIEMGRQVIAESRKRFGRVALVPGNHEWRLTRRALRAQLTPEQEAGLLGGPEPFEFTSLSFVILNEVIRVTHPGSASIIPGAVARALSEKHHQHVIVGHGHGLGYARSYGGQYWCIESGGLFDPGRMDYSFSVDKRRPQANQGFVIVDGVTPYLIDPAACCGEALMHFARTRSKARRAA